MKQVSPIGLMIFTAVFCWQGMLCAQGTEEKQKALTFFMEKALEDATYEQNIKLSSLEDEIDFWKDQRNYEQALKKKSYTGYQVYVNTKLEAYENHSLVCETPQKHGGHYFLQANFYAEQGKRVQIKDNATAENTQIH